MAARRGHRDRGSASLFLAIVAVALMAMAGLVIDGGNTLDAREEASNVAESAARAGANQVSEASLRGGGPALVDPTRGPAAAQRILAELGRSGSVQVSGDTVTVTVTITQKMAILSAVGVQPVTVTGRATARSVAGLVTEI